MKFYKYFNYIFILILFLFLPIFLFKLIFSLNKLKINNSLNSSINLERNKREVFTGMVLMGMGVAAHKSGIFKKVGNLGKKFGNSLNKKLNNKGYSKK